MVVVKSGKLIAVSNRSGSLSKMNIVRMPTDVFRTSKLIVKRTVLCTNARRPAYTYQKL